MPVTRSVFPQKDSSACFRLSCCDGTLEDSLPLECGVNVVGRGIESDLRLDLDGVSRRHALLVVRPNEVLVIDCESKNGTRVDGKIVRSAIVEVGSHIAFGPVRWELEPIHHDDTTLAVRLFPAAELPGPPTGGSSGGRHEETRTADRMRFAESLVEIVLSHGEHAGPLLLGELTRGLGVEAVAEVTLDSGEPTVLRSLGEAVELDIAGFLTACLERLQGTEASSAFVAHGATAGFALRRGSEIRALVFSADISCHRDIAPLLSITLMLLELISRRDTRELAASGTGLRELVFPPGYQPSRSPAMEPVYKQLRALTVGDLPVLLVGETGVGKECLVDTIHRSSSRREAPLVAINCAAIPPELLEAELFGIGDRVATGVAGRPGRFREAQGGTLFLDEIGEMPRDLQAKLLRVLEQRRLEGLGTAGFDIDVRLVAATNAEVGRLVDEGIFRRDLFYRLAGSVVRIPPLRSRREDIASLIEVFARRASNETGKAVRGVSLRALRRLVSHDWPGNVRELKHLITRLVYQCAPGGIIDSDLVDWALEGGDLQDAPAASLPTLHLEKLERRAIEEALSQSGGNQGQAAELLGISRFALRRRLERHLLRMGSSGEEQAAEEPAPETLAKC